MGGRDETLSLEPSSTERELKREGEDETGGQRLDNGLGLTRPEEQISLCKSTLKFVINKFRCGAIYRRDRKQTGDKNT